MADKFGMMSQAYFKGKRELLNWISTFLEMEIPKVETLATGAHYCQLMDALFPGSIKMSKVKFGAYLEEDYVKNWKLVQIAFGKEDVQKVIPIERLVQARFQDNLEFLQWFHQYFTSSYRGTGDYNPVDRRRRSKGMNQVKPLTIQNRRNRVIVANNPRRRNTTPQRQNREIVANNTPGRKDRANDKLKLELKHKIAKVAEKKDVLEKELQRISETARAIENERDFYFQVLLKVENMCKNCTEPDKPDIKKIMEILYTPKPNDEGGEDQSDEVVAEDDGVVNDNGVVEDYRVVEDKDENTDGSKDARDSEA